MRRFKVGSVVTVDMELYRSLARKGDKRCSGHENHTGFIKLLILTNEGNGTHKVRVLDGDGDPMNTWGPPKFVGEERYYEFTTEWWVYDKKTILKEILDKTA